MMASGPIASRFAAVSNSVSPLLEELLDTSKLTTLEPNLFDCTFCKKTVATFIFSFCLINYCIIAYKK